MNTFSKLLLLVFFITALQLNAQFTPKTTGISSFSRFFKSETYFVLTKNDKINKALIEAVDSNWTITKAKIINTDTFELMSRDRDKSFVYIKNLKQKGIGKPVKALCLVNGGYDEMATYITNTLAYVSLDNEGYEANEEEIIYRLGHLLVQLQDVVQIIKDEKIIEKTPEKVRDKMQKYYMGRCKPLQEKTLLVDKRYLNQKIISQSEFEKNYKFDVEFVSKDVIAKAIKSKDATAAYLVSALNLYKINSVADCETGKIIYVDFEEENKVTYEFERNFDLDDILQLNGHVRIGK